MEHTSAIEKTSPQQAACLLGCSRTMVYKLVSRGELPGFRVGRRLVLDKADVLAFLEAHRVRVGEPA